MNLTRGFGRLGIFFAVISVIALTTLVTIAEAWHSNVSVTIICSVLFVLYYAIFSLVGWLLKEMRDLGAIRSKAIIAGLLLASVASLALFLFLYENMPAIRLGLALIATLPLVAATGFAIPLAVVRFFAWTLRGFEDDD